jgi:predicted amidohydrolase YtcJ
MPGQAPDLILHRGRFTTLDRSNPTASAVAITNACSPPSGATKM